MNLWKNTKKEILWFSRSYHSYNIDFINGRSKWHYPPFSSYQYGWENYIFPKRDHPDDSIFTKTLKPNDVLYFDPSSEFPRFKLGLTNNKRCIKTTKANAVVVSGKKTCSIASQQNMNVYEDNENRIIIIDTESFASCFNNDVFKLITYCNNLQFQIEKLTLIYSGLLESFAKESLWIPNYLDGMYNVPLIKDVVLDKIICNMCPDVTLDEINSIYDMLSSSDKSVVQLGMKMITGFNVDKYRLTFRMLLYSTDKWVNCCRNTVACDQLINTLNINYRYPNSNFEYVCRWFEEDDYTYTVEDIALAKQFGGKLIKKHLESFYKELINEGYKWVPDSFSINVN